MTTLEKVDLARDAIRRYYDALDKRRDAAKPKLDYLNNEWLRNELWKTEERRRAAAISTRPTNVSKR